MQLPCVESLDRAFVKGEQIILCQSLERGFAYSELGLSVISERELYGDVAARRKSPAQTPPIGLFRIERGGSGGP